MRQDLSRSAEEIRISEAYYGEAREVERSSKIFMRSFIPEGKGRVLDIGCGTGVNAEAIAAKGHSVSGIDISETAVARFRACGFSGTVGDIIHGLPYEDGQFDIAFASEVIEHVSDTAKFLSEARRVLRPGGTLLLSTPNSASWIMRVYALLGRTLSEVQHPGHVRFFSKQSLESAVEASGFNVVRVASRNMYLAVPFDFPWLAVLGFAREFRFKTGKYFWHISRPAQRASRFWAETLIVEARKI